MCAQDHGVPPPGESHLDFRHSMFTDLLEKNPYPHTLLFEADEVPEALNRLRCLALSARSFPTAEVYVMDSGMAAMLGGSMDILAKQKQHLLILDVATSHTVGAAMRGDEIAGFFEYHTSDITLARLEQLMVDLCEGKLEHSRVLSEGGHGAFGRRSFGFDAVEGESILLMLDREGICASSGSACTSGSLDPSHVLMAMKVPFKSAHGSIRFSMSHYNTKEEMDHIIKVVPPVIQKLRDMSPFWKDGKVV